MTQSQLNRAVARTTGESTSTIAHLGFVPLTVIPIERERLTVDCDGVDTVLASGIWSRNMPDHVPPGKRRRRPTRRKVAHVVALRPRANRGDSQLVELGA